MPQNCSADIQKVVDHVDQTLLLGQAKDKQSLKDLFGLGGLTQDDDFVSALQIGRWLFQDNSKDSGSSEFYEFCDYIEVSSVT
jgi:hypothetical protein